MKEYAACESRMQHSLGPRLREYPFEVVNALLTVPGAVGNFAGSPILLQVETTEEVSGRSSTHRKGRHNNNIDACEDLRAS